MSSTTSPTSIQPKELAIIPENALQIQLYLDQMQSDAHAGIVSSDDIFRIAEEAESVLENVAYHKLDRVGAKYVQNPYVAKDRASRYKRLGTSINIKRRSKGWVLTSAEREMISAGCRGRIILLLTDKQMTAAFMKVILSP